MFEDGSGPVISVQDVADLLHQQHAILTGGKTKDGCPIITFPDNGVFCNLPDDDYQKLILYLTSMPSLHDADLGFALVIDRRNDKWASVRSVLLKICSFFPGLVQTVFVLRPAGFLQKAISEVSNKFFKEEFKFKLVVCSSIEELHEFIDPRELTEDLRGCIAYDHKEWIEQRTAIENFSRHTRDISQNLHLLVTRLQETELPNDASGTKEILRIQTKEFHALKDDLRTMTGNGEALLKLLRHPCTRSPSAVAGCSSSEDRCPESKLVNVTAVERLLVQLEETESGFDHFWRKHEDRLQQCLELRRFEHEFRDLQTALDTSLRQLTEVTDLGDSVARIDELLQEAEDFRDNCKDDLEKAAQLGRIGLQLIESQHYAVDSIQPKCLELHRVCEDMDGRLRERIRSLHRHRDLQERVERANNWCARGVDLLAGQNLERCSSTPEFARIALREIDAFLRSSAECRLNDPKEFRNLFKDMITPETTALVQQVLRRIEDVQVMCEKKRASLQKLAEKPSRPVQPVNPEPAVPLTTSTSTTTTIVTSELSPQSNGNGDHRRTNDKDAAIVVTGGGNGGTTLDGCNDVQPEGTKKYARKARTLSKAHARPTSHVRSDDTETFESKQKHVTDELMETERVYVMELNSIIRGYKEEMIRPASRHLVPPHLLGNEDIIFGNMEDIHRFHNDVFLRDLENCVDTPELIGLCFIQRKESLHKLYTVYCQNKPKSEALRREGGDNLPFFKECQQRLAHKLPLSAYLLKPIQRITKYQLLLKDLLKYSGDDGRGKRELQEAVDCMLDVLRYVNDSMHQVAITGFTGRLADLGRLLLQGSFNVWSARKSERLKELRLKPTQRHLFLYEKAVLFCKKVCDKVDEGRSAYCFKRCLKMSQVGLTESVSKGGSKSAAAADSRKFELWTSGRTEVHVIQAPSLEVKELWVKEVKAVLVEQFVHIKQQHRSMKTQKQFASLLNGVQSSATANTTTATPQRSLRTSFDNWDSKTTALAHSNKATSEEVLSRRKVRHGQSLDGSSGGGGGGDDGRSDFESDARETKLRTRSKSASARPFVLPHVLQHPWMDSGGIAAARCRRSLMYDYNNDDEEEEDVDEDEDEVEVEAEAEAEKSDDDLSDSDVADEDPFDRTTRLAGGGGRSSSMLVTNRLVSLSDYDAVNATEVTLREGDIVELIKVGSAGWSYVSVVGTDRQGWAPASYMEPITTTTARSSLTRSSFTSSSQDSIAGAGNFSTVADRRNRESYEHETADRPNDYDDVDVDVDVDDYQFN